MFCPNCGIDEKLPNQFCRACGTDLRPVRDAVSVADSITQSAANAREEIGRAVAAKIRETQDVYELKKVAEDVLPEIEKFLESPAEKRLRRMRNGGLLTMIGIGVSIAFFVISFITDKELFIVSGLGFVTFCLGIAFLINGWLLTVPGRGTPDNAADADQQRQLDAAVPPMLMSEAATLRSVTEQTTTDLSAKERAYITRD